MKWLTPQWPAPTGVRALSTLRGGGFSAPPYDSLNLGHHVGDDAAAVARNRRALRAAANLPAEPQWLEQVHGAGVRDLDAFGADPVAAGGHALRATHEAGADDAMPAVAAAGPADAAVTGRPGRVCAILTADCLPVLFTAVSGARVGAAHAGWRGLAAGVLEATVEALAVPPRDLMAWLGPAIGPAQFEVGAEVREALLGADLDAPSAFELNARGRYLADLYALARSRLARLGVGAIYGGDGCTVSESLRFFSHRRDGRTGRQATLIWLEPPPGG